MKLLEDELGVTRRKLEQAPRQIHLLEKRLAETSAELTKSRDSNELLDRTLREARDQLVALNKEVDKLSQPPATYGIFLRGYEEDGNADIFTNGRKIRVNVTPEVNQRHKAWQGSDAE